jgi:hypothetical protein
MVTQQITQKARSTRRRRSLLQLLQLPLRLFQRILLHQYRLRQNIKRVRIPAQPLVEQLFRFRILLCEPGLRHTIRKIVQHLFFFGSHFIS